MSHVHERRCVDVCGRWIALAVGLSGVGERRSQTCGAWISPVPRGEAGECLGGRRVIRARICVRRLAADAGPARLVFVRVCAAGRAGSAVAAERFNRSVLRSCSPSAPMSFFSAPAYKPAVRQEGFHLPSPPPDPASPPPAAQSNPSPAGFNDLFNLGPHQFLPDQFRKFPSAGSADNGGINFDDELASLIGPQSNERSTQSPGASHQSASFDENGTYHHTRNIFDISAPLPQPQMPLASSASSTTSAFSSHFSHINGNGPNTNAASSSSINANSNGTHSQPSSLHSPSMLSEFTPPHTHFNSTLPSLNSSMRYEPHPDAPPSSYHFNNRHTPSPIHHQPSHSHDHSRSRSRSRPPSSGSAGPTANGGGGVGPARTTRARRNNSVSSTSPPPHGRPHAIVIPRTNSNNNGGAMSPLAAAGGGWFMPGHS